MWSEQPGLERHTLAVLSVIGLFVFLFAIAQFATPSETLTTCGGWSTRAPDGKPLCLPQPTLSNETPPPYPVGGGGR